MKRMIFSGCIILIFASMVLVSYGAMTREPISTENLPDLKGKWEGWRTPLQRGTTQSYRTDLEIYNDTLPLKGKVTFYDVERKDKLGGTIFNKFNTGQINNEGDFVIESGEHTYNLSLYKDKGEMKLEGKYDFRQTRGTISLKKK
jgi:hypothetical protein